MFVVPTFILGTGITSGIATGALSLPIADGALATASGALATAVVD
jgi:hypothetical protein